MKTLPIPVPSDRIVEFCQRWKISKFALFGSVLREDFRPIERSQNWIRRKNILESAQVVYVAG